VTATLPAPIEETPVPTDAPLVPDAAAEPTVAGPTATEPEATEPSTPTPGAPSA